jgi:hypothetical protein
VSPFSTPFNKTTNGRHARGQLGRGGAGATDLLDSAPQKAALRFGSRQLQRSLEGCTSLAESVHPTQELCASRVEVLVAVEVEPLEEHEPRFWPFRLGDRDRPVHVNDR